MTSYGDIWADMYDPVHDMTEDIPFWVEEAVASGGPVLELGCGTGRVAIPVAKAGVRVVGLDNSLSMLKQARAKARKLGLSSDALKFVRGEMQAFSLEERFALAIIPYRSFQALLSIGEQQQALASIKANLVPGGKLIFDLWVPDVDQLVADASMPFLDRETTDPETGRRYLVWHRDQYDTLNQILYGHAIVEELDPQGVVLQRVYKDFTSRYLHRFEAQHLLEATGYRITEVYGGFNREPLDETSDEMVLVAVAQS